MSQLQVKFKKAKRLAAAGEYDKALRVVEDLCKDADAWPDLLVLKGDLIQVTDEGAYTLEDAEAAYNEAIEIDPAHVEAYTELSELYASVLDEPEKARNVRQQGKDAILRAWKKLADTAADTDEMKPLYYLACLQRLGVGQLSQVREALASLLSIQEDEHGDICWPEWEESISRDELEKAGH